MARKAKENVFFRLMLERVNCKRDERKALDDQVAKVTIELWEAVPPELLPFRDWLFGKENAGLLCFAGLLQRLFESYRREWSVSRGKRSTRLNKVLDKSTAFLLPGCVTVEDTINLVYRLNCVWPTTLHLKVARQKDGTALLFARLRDRNGRL